MNELIVEKIKEILTEDLSVDLPPEEIKLDDGFQAVLGLDSISFIELRYQCGEVFQIEILDEDFIPENFSTLSSLSRLIEKYIKNRKGV